MSKERGRRRRVALSVLLSYKILLFSQLTKAKYYKQTAYMNKMPLFWPEIQSLVRGRKVPKMNFWKSISLILLVSICNSTNLSARTWSIKVDGSGDAPTIQAGIDSAGTGDVVRVSAGRYVENIDFKGKAISVLGSGAETTIIDGSGQEGSCVLFVSGEDRRSVLCDFTVTGGTGTVVGQDRWGGGIYIRDSEPTIRFNIITGNKADVFSGGPTGFGGGILCFCDAVVTSPLIEGNQIIANSAGSNGGGIGVSGGSLPQIRNNIIRDNRVKTGDGGGIWLLIKIGGSVIDNNVIQGNQVGDHGGGIYIANTGTSPTIDVEIVNNLIVSNIARWESRVVSAGGGMWLAKCRALVSRNTIVLNIGFGPDSTSGGGIALDRSGTSIIERNIISFSEGGGIRCDGNGPPTIRNNLASQNAGGDGISLCQGWTQADGNIVADPLFCGVDVMNFTVAGDSPALTHPAGPLGAFVVAGCGPVAIRPTTWGAIKTKFIRSGQ